MDVAPFGGPGGIGGGLFEPDILHPTIVGYGMKAQSVCDVTAETERLRPSMIDLQRCYGAGSLLQDPPSTIGPADSALHFPGASIKSGSIAATDRRRHKA